MEEITLAGGCFWCTEAVFQKLKGVEKVDPGYANSKVESPSYEQVCSGKTGAAEAIQVTFNPKVISLEKILDVFWATHDPTTLNKQGADSGTQYRSGIYYHDLIQKKTAQESFKKAEKSGRYSDKFVTEIVPLENFYPSEDYHKDYYKQNPNQPYCILVIDPKIQKLYKEFKADLKSSD